MKNFKIIFTFISCFFYFPCSTAFANGQISNEALQFQIKQLSRLVEDLQQTVENQQREIALMKGQTPPPFTTGRMQAPESAQQLSGKWNPDTGVVSDIVLQSDSAKTDSEGADRISVRELEIAFGSAVDPYTRMDVTLGIADFETMSIEEAYVTRFGLPLEFTARLGRFLPKIGKAIPVHRDTLETVDEPMVIERYFGHHGFSKSGIDVTRSIDLPWNTAHEITLGVLEGGNGEEGSLFGETRRRPTVYSHLKNYVDWNDETGFELGATFLSGSRDEDASFEVGVIGLDGTLIYRYADQRHLKFQSEAFYMSRCESFYESTDVAGNLIYEDLDDARHLWGSYLLVDWRLHPKWATGIRFDSVQRVETGTDFAAEQSFERGYTGYLTFYQSEFARWRLQFSHIDLTAADHDDKIYLQGTFAIGEHKHKLT
jgi:hypothetical protein